MIIGNVHGKNMGGWTPIDFGGTPDEFDDLIWAFSNMPKGTMAAIRAATVDARIQESFDACRKILENFNNNKY